jgi:hypothetical protein
MKVSGEKEKKKNQTALHHTDTSAQHTSSGDKPERRGIRKSGNDRGGKYQNDTNAAYQNFRHSTQRRIATQEVSKNLANHNKFYERFNYQKGKRTPPISRS